MTFLGYPKFNFCDVITLVLTFLNATIKADVSQRATALKPAQQVTGISWTGPTIQTRIGRTWVTCGNIKKMFEHRYPKLTSIVWVSYCEIALKYTGLYGNITNVFRSYKYEQETKIQAISASFGFTLSLSTCIYRKEKEGTFLSPSLRVVTVKTISSFKFHLKSKLMEEFLT